MKKKLLATASLTGLLPLVASVQAGENYVYTSSKAVVEPAPPADTLWTRDKLTGDWGGLRTDLANSGIHLDLRLSQYGQWVTSGGVYDDGAYGGTLDYRVKLDGAKIGLWEGFSIDMHARTRFGRDVSAAAGPLALQNTGLLMPGPARYNGTDITGLMINQAFPVGDDHIGVFSIGKIDILDAVTMFFPSVGYGQEGFQNVNSMISALPWFGAVDGLSLYGGWLATINKKHQIGQSAVLVTGTQNVTTDWGSLSESFDEVWIAAFHRFIWEMDEKMGYFMVFGGFSTRDQKSNQPNDFVVIPGQGLVNTDEEKPWDIALYLYQDFWQDKNNPSRKANFMVGGTVGPDNPQFAQWNVFANVEAYGLIGSRPHDRMGFGGWYNGLSDNFKELTSPVVGLQDLWGLEAYYNFQITPAARVTADLQLVQGAREKDDVAFIPGVRMVIDF